MRALQIPLIAALLLFGVFLESAETTVHALPPGGTDTLPVVATATVASRIGTETIVLTGLAKVVREAPHVEGSVEVVDMEVVSFDLSGVSLIGAISVSERPNSAQDYVSAGEIRSLQPGQDFPASSFFDVYVDVTAPSSPAGTVETHNETAMRMTPRDNGQPVDLSAWPPLGVTYQLDPIFGVDNDGDTLVDEDSADDDQDGLFDEDRPGADPDTPGSGSECGINPDCDGQEGEDPPFDLCTLALCDEDGDGQIDEDPSCIPLMNAANVNNMKLGYCVRDLTLEFAPEMPSFSVARGGPSGIHPADILALGPGDAGGPPTPVAVSGNDDFAGAWVIPEPSFIGLQDTSGATLESVDTGLLSPTAEQAEAGGDGDGFELNPTDAFADGGGFAEDVDSGTVSSLTCTSPDRDRHIYRDFNVNTGALTTITGIEVRLDASTDSTSGFPRMCVELSWNGGVNWTPFPPVATGLSPGEATYLLGGPTASWQFIGGWEPDELTNTNFRLRISNVALGTDRDFQLDWVAVRVFEQAEPQPCGSIGNTTWYSLTPTQSGALTIDTVGSDFDTVLAAYTGSDVYGLTEIDCNDDFSGAGPSRLTLPVTAGTTYYIQAGGYAGATGDLTLNVSAGDEGPFVRIPCSNLGLTPDGCDDGGDGDQDDVDALSYGGDLPPAAPQQIFFSVGPGAQGAPGSAVEGQRNCPPAAPGSSPEPEPDEFGSVLNSTNDLVLDGNGPIGSCQSAFPIGLYEGPTERDDLDALYEEDPVAVDPDFDGLPDGAVYFSLDATSPSLSALSQADVLKTVGGGAPTAFATEAALGLQAGDDLDALCLRESGDATYVPGEDTLYFSLAPSSPTLALISAGPGDMLIPGSPPAVIQPAGSAGLAAGDDMNALKCQGLKNPDGDTDGDTIPNSVDPDDDNDSCLDDQEFGSDFYSGGLRDPHNFWDFFDVHTGNPLARDGDISGLDIFTVIGRFNATDAGPGDFDRNDDPLSTPNPADPSGTQGAYRQNYHPSYDRGALVGPNAWNLGPADGAISGLEIFAVIGQFGSSCP